jgi:hypothetical protein
MPLTCDAAPGCIRAILGTRIVTGAACLPLLKTGAEPMPLPLPVR